MEVLMVVVLIGIAVGVTFPFLVNSIRGHRVRTASRTMVMAARYARSMAVIKQHDMNIQFDLDTGKVDLVSSNTALPAFTRELKGVRMAYVQVEDEEPVEEGKCVVQCRRTGVCDPFKVRIEDAYGNYILIKVDALASVKTKEEGKDL